MPSGRPMQRRPRTSQSCGARQSTQAHKPRNTQPYTTHSAHHTTRSQSTTHASHRTQYTAAHTTHMCSRCLRTIRVTACLPFSFKCSWLRSLTRHNAPPVTGPSCSKTKTTGSRLASRSTYSRCALHFRLRVATHSNSSGHRMCMQPLEGGRQLPPALLHAHAADTKARVCS